MIGDNIYLNGTVDFPEFHIYLQKMVHVSGKCQQIYSTWILLLFNIPHLKNK